MARRAVDGVQEATIETGEDVRRAAKAAVDGAIKAAGEISTHTARTVAGVLAGVVQGIKEAGASAAPHPPVVHQMAARKRTTHPPQRAHRR